MSNTPKLRIQHLLFLLAIVIVTFWAAGQITYIKAKQRFLVQENAIDNEFNKFFTTVKAYSKMIVVNDSIHESRAAKVLEDPYFPLFQFRHICKEGKERLKVDSYGYTNLNDVSTRPYWKPMDQLQPGEWYVTLAQSNWENDSVSGTLIVTASETFRFFQRLPETVNGRDHSFLAYNVDYSKSATALEATFDNLSFENYRDDYKQGFHLNGFNLSNTHLVSVEDHGMVYPVVLVSTNYPLGYTLLFTMLVVTLLVFFYLNWIRIKQSVDLELLMEQQQNSFTANWINMASHYFRHPVANITSNLELLTLKGIISKDQKEVVKMLGSLDEFLEIFNHLQKVNILHALNERTLNSVDLHSLVHTLSQSHSNQLKISVVCDPKIELTLDRETFSWAFTEILENAIYHGRAQNITLNISELRGTLLLRINDDGVGMDESLVDQINRKEIEIKSDGIETGKFGLGFYQVVRIMDQHGFELSIDETVRRGTSILIKVPQEKCRIPSAS